MVFGKNTPVRKKGHTDPGFEAIIKIKFCK